ncbi:aminodeoxychorismate synthase component I [Isosphaeraceae bacterium EP7]
MTAERVLRNVDVSPAALPAIVGRWTEPALLESGPGFGAAGRWSILAAEPRLVFQGGEAGWTVEDQHGLTLAAGQSDPLAALADLVRRFGLDRPGQQRGPDECPFQGGLVGFFGYDLAPTFETLPRKATADSRMPDVRFGLYDTAILVDHASGQAAVHAWDLLGEGRDAPASRVEDWSRRVARPSPMRPPTPPRFGDIRSNFEPDEYRRAVGRALEYLRAGDIFQVNLSQRFTVEGIFDPPDLYASLKLISPAPYSAMLRWGDFAVLSASPELFYTTEGRRIVTRPIKGTRPRGRDAAEDARLAAELKSSAKDRAELTMIVDLERNDLGRVCEYGSVTVSEALAVESFAQVHHLVATVEGRLREDVGPIDVVRAMFPGGSITGAPKIRAMEIIDELEPVRRGLYTGSIGYLSQGRSAFNIAIRTILVEGPRASYQVGGGIVVDSDPDAEYRETLDKGRALYQVLGGGVYA